MGLTFETERCALQGHISLLVNIIKKKFNIIFSPLLLSLLWSARRHMCDPKWEKEDKGGAVSSLRYSDEFYSWVYKSW
jgi:hypothetical protein